MIFKSIGLVSPAQKNDLPSTYQGDSINLDSPNTYQEFQSNLSDGSCIVTMMSELPLTLPEPMQIGALLSRYRPNLSLYIKEQAIEMTEDFRLARGASFRADQAITAAQIMDLREDISYIHDDNIEVDAIIKWDRDPELEMTGYQKFVLHTKEMIPPVGTGIVAVVVSEANKDLRKTVQADHNKILGSCSNVERTLAKLCQQNGIKEYAAYCETDNNGYYHASACAIIDKKLKKSTISQSTYAEIANLLYHQLKH
jgi:hypothetical protein